MSDLREWHQVTLPSLGLYYGGACPDGVVEITPWTTSQEERLVRTAGAGMAKVINQLIHESVRFPEGMTGDDLVIADQHYLLMKIRAISLVSSYTVDHKCPSCKVSSEITYDIDTLPVVTPEPETQDTFDVFLPRCGKTATLRMLRVRDEKKIVEYRDQKRSIGMTDADSDIYVYSLARQVDKVNGEDLKFDEKKDFIRGLIMLDLSIIKQESEDREVGLDTEVKATCASCGHVDTWDLPIQVGFFRPKRADLAAAVALARSDRG